MSDRSREIFERRLKKNWKRAQLNGHKVIAEDRRDGLKLIFEGGGWLLIRLSGTEPKIRLSEQHSDTLFQVCHLLGALHRVFLEEVVSQRRDSLRHRDFDRPYGHKTVKLKVLRREGARPALEIREI